MELDRILNHPGARVIPETESGIVVSSRVRVARNLRAFSFPGWLDVDGRVDVWQTLLGAIQEIPACSERVICPMSELTEMEKHLLFERHLISREMMARGEGCGVIVCPEDGFSLMINEEDHIRLQVLDAGLNLQSALKQADALDDAIEAQAEYAFSSKWGYLTSCPTNVGTGLRASVMLHLPALVLMQEMRPIINGLSKIGIAVRGLWGENTEAAGHMFQVSNQVTLGDSEEGIISQNEQIVQELVQHEENARIRLLEEKNVLLQDHLGRAGGILEKAHLLSSKEALNLLSALRLGIELKLITHLRRSVIDELLLLTQPAHLQKMFASDMKPDERDQARAELVKKRITQQTGD
ncbi:MAG: protein arginine kinase [Kiritimatiellae bacterium]|nr:protein arginine kinase [Kiritimatiellia bacterium]